MSSEALVEGPNGVLAAWETTGQVMFALIDGKTLKVASPIGAPGVGRDRKHPALAQNAAGETILVWTEGTGWQRGGTLAWQVYDKAGKPTTERGRIPNGIPVWSLATVTARPGGGFVIIH